MTSNISKGECCEKCRGVRDLELLKAKGWNRFREEPLCKDNLCLCHQEPVGVEITQEAINEWTRYLTDSKEPSWVGELESNFFFGNDMLPEFEDALKDFIRKTRQEAFEEGKETMLKELGAPETFAEVRKEALTSLLAQIPEEMDAGLHDFKDGYNEAVAYIRELINKQINN